MKTKITKILGVALTVAVIASLFSFVVPVSAGDMAFTKVGTPDTYGTDLVADPFDVSVLAVGSDGSTMFAYDNNNALLYKSTNAGKTWSTNDIGGTLETNTVVAMAVSPNYATDSIVVAATAGVVYRSTNGGKTFGAVGTPTLVGSITSVAVGQWYLGGGESYLIGTSDGAGSGDVQIFTSTSLTWTAQTLAEEVYAVAFSPNHASDAQIMAVTTDGAGTNTYVRTKFASNVWDADVAIGTKSTYVATAAALAFPDDYDWAANNKVLVGIATSGTTGDVFRYSGALAGGTTQITDLNVGGSATETAPVTSLAMKGSFASAKVLVGLANSASIKRTSDPSASSVSWYSSTKSPTGTANGLVAWAGDHAVCGTSGTNSSFSKSMDDGKEWNGLSMLSVSAITNLTMVDLAVIDSSTMFLIVADSGGGANEQLFRSTDGGSSWERVWSQANMMYLAPSPNYATDSTIYVGQTDTRVWKSTNGGDTWVGYTAPAAITAIMAVDDATYYSGHAAAVYKSGRWTAATSVSGSVKSFAMAGDGTIYIGNDAGRVQKSTNDAASFSTVGNVGFTGGNTYVALHPSYASNMYVYAGGSNGLYRFKEGTDSLWTKYKTLNNPCTGVHLSPDGTLYAGDSTQYVGTTVGGVHRSVDSYKSPGGTTFENVGTDLPSTNPFGAKVQNLELPSDSTTLYVIVSNLTGGLYDIGAAADQYKVYVFTDQLAVEPTLKSPKSGSVTGTSVTFMWTAVPSAKRLTYTVDVSLDGEFENTVAGSGATTSGTSYVFTGLTPGQKYYWRITVTSPLTSKESAAWTFVPALSAPSIQSPRYFETTSDPRPTFSWLAVRGAGEYELQLADNPFYANSIEKKPLSHTVWTWDEELEFGTTYYWRVRGIGADTDSPWAEASFTVGTAETSAPTTSIVVPTQPAPTITVDVPAPELAIPAIYLWVIIIIGAVLVIVVIVLIVRTRRTP